MRTTQYGVAASENDLLESADFLLVLTSDDTLIWYLGKHYKPKTLLLSVSDKKEIDIFGENGKTNRGGWRELFFGDD